MKYVYQLLSVLLLFHALISVVNAQQDGENWIPDENLRTAVRASLELAAGEALTQERMLDFTELKAAAREISNLTGLEHATNLTIARLAHNQISDISPLSGLTSLTKLRLQDNNITNLSSLSGLTNLTELFLFDNQIIDVTPLAKLVNLVKLRIAGNPITDASPLSSLTNLNHVDITIPDPPQDDPPQDDPPQDDPPQDDPSQQNPPQENPPQQNNSPPEPPADVDPPNVSISVSSGLQNGAFDVTITFTELVSDFTQEDLVVSGNASITAWTVNSDNTTYTATITPTSSGEVTLRVDAGVASDTATNPNTAAIPQTVTVDMDRPRVSLSVPSKAQSGAFDVTILFTEPVSDFDQTDIALTGNTASATITSWNESEDGSTYTATITPTESGEVSIRVRSDVAIDAAGNNNRASGTQTIRVDVDPPSVSISVPSDDQTGAFDVTITFTEPVSGFEQSDLSISGTANATITAWNTTDDTTYAATITPTTTGTVKLSVAADVATDVASNPNAATAVQTVTVFVTQQQIETKVATVVETSKEFAKQQQTDTNLPSVSITVPSGKQNGAFEAVIIFSESVSGFEQSDLSISGTANASITAWDITDETTYTATITPTTSGEVILNVAAGVATDSASNLNTAATQKTVAVDMTRPTVTITPVNTEYHFNPQNIPTFLPSYNSEFIVHIRFSESVDNFEVSDIIVTGTASVSISNFIDRIGVFYIATITPLGSEDGSVIFNIPEDAAEDSAGNGNTAATEVECRIDNTSPTVNINVPSEVQRFRFVVGFQFNEPISNFSANKVIITGTAGSDESHGVTIVGTPGAFGTNSDRQLYDITIQVNRNTEGTVSFGFPENIAVDGAGNGNTAATQQTVEIDNRQPEHTLTVPSEPQNGPFNVEVEFSEPVYGFMQSELIVAPHGNSASITAWTGEDGDQTYTATITPGVNQSEELRIVVANAVAEDRAGNFSRNTTLKRVQVDTVRPTVTIDVPSEAQNGAFTITVEFSEAVEDFLQSELIVTGTAGASITAWEPQDGGTEYIATITPTQTGNAFFNVAENSVTDDANNGNTAATQQTVAVNITRPTVTIDVPSNPQNDAFTVTVEFSETVEGFLQSELLVTGTSGASITNWQPQTGGTDYTATITPTQSGNAFFNITENVATDTAGNGNTAPTQQTVTVDMTRPDVSITVPQTVQHKPFGVTVTFTEPVSGFDQNELVVGGTAGVSITNWQPQTGGTDYIATITPTQTGNAFFNVKENVAMDAAENGNTAATQKTVVVDMIQPTVTIDVPSELQNGVFTVTIEFSEAVTGFLQSELLVTGTAGASITNWQPQTGGTEYIATITPTQTGNAFFNVAENSATDDANNGNTAATQQTVAVDMTRPTPTIDVPSNPQNGAFTVTVEFSEVVTDFLQSELIVTGTSGASITNWQPQTGGTEYIATITPTQTGNAFFNVKENVAMDAAENGNTAATQKTVVVDMIQPTVTIDVPSELQNGVFTVTIEFSEAVTGFLQSELLVTGTAGASITAWEPQDGGTEYIATITPTQTGNAFFNVKENVAMDAANNLNTAATQQTVAVDITRPTVTIDVPSKPQNDAFTVTVKFSETVEGFLQSELIVTGTSGASITAWQPQTGGTDYIATITPTQTGNAIFNVTENVAMDAANNLNTAATQQTVAVDITRPTVTIDVPSKPQNDAFTVTVKFSETVEGFLQSELLVTGTASASITNWQPQTGGTDYIATITPTQTGTTIFNVNANVALDTAGNGNTAPIQKTVDVDITRPTVTINAPSNPQNDAFTVTVKFSETVEGFLQSELLVTGTSGASITNWQPQTGGTDYVATVTPLQTGNVIFNVNANAAEDAVNNGNIAAIQQTVTVDMTRPDVSITVPQTVQHKPFGVTVTFTEPVSGFEQNELVVGGTAGASITNWQSQTGGTDYIATITSSQTGNAIFNIAENVALDTAGNGNTVPTQEIVLLDLDRPIVSIVSPSEPQNDVFIVTVKFNETVNGFQQSELLVTGTASASITAWQPQPGGTDYIATITPSQTGDTIFNVNAHVATDDVGNGNIAAIQQTVAVDMILPDVSIIVPQTVQHTTFEVMVIFTEPVSGFGQDELVIGGTSGASITNWQPQTGGTDYIATITPSQTGNAIFNVAENSATDTAGNGNTAAIQQIVSLDLDPPLVSIVSSSEPQNGAFIVGVEFSETVNGFQQSELLVTGTASASITNWQPQNGETDYIATITPAQTGTAIFNVEANVAEDAARNGNVSATERVVEVDMIRPSVTIDLPNDVQTEDFEVTVRFSEPVKGFTRNELLISEATNVTLTNWNAHINRQQYTATITPETDKNITLVFWVPADVAHDDAGNGNEPSQSEIEGVRIDTTYRVRIDTTYRVRIDPETHCPILRVPQNIQTGPFDVHISFLEPVDDFKSTELRLAGVLEAGITNWRVDSNGSDYHATIVPRPFKRMNPELPMHNGTVTLHIPEGVATDKAGHKNTAVIETVAVTLPDDSEDTKGPWVILDVPTGPQAGAFDVRIIFTESVKDFLDEDLSVSPSDTLIKNWTSDAYRRHYTVTVEPTMSGTVVLSIAGDVAQDDAGNGNHAAMDKSVEVVFPEVTDTEKPTVTIAVQKDNLVGPFDAVIQFSEPVTGFRQNELNFSEPCFLITRWEPNSNRQAYVVTITPTQNGTVTLSVLEDIAQDPAGNWNTAAEITVEVTLPDIHVYIESPTTVREDFDMTVVFTKPVTGFMQEELLFTADSTAAAHITNWDTQERGTRYTVEITATKNGALTLTVPAGATEEGNVPAEPVRVLISPEDVDQNNTVDMQDLSIVSKHFGQYITSEQEKNPDVDRDGIVTIEDFALIQARIEENLDVVAVSPQNLQSLLERLKGLDESNPALQQDIQALEARLVVLLPKITALLPNYPNPFNPETWIPYHLASSSDVQIEIYDLRGRLTRTLELGTQSAGYYTDRSRAAYWNGRNNVGERVGSGIYFYRLQTNDVSILRKMVIVK